MIVLGLLVFNYSVADPGIRFRLPVHNFAVGSSVPAVGLIVIIESLSYLFPVRNFVSGILFKERDDFFKAFWKIRLRSFRSSVEFLLYLFLHVLKDDFFLTIITHACTYALFILCGAKFTLRYFFFFFFFLFYRGCRGIVFFFFVLFFFRITKRCSQTYPFFCIFFFVIT